MRLLAIGGAALGLAACGPTPGPPPDAPGVAEVPEVPKPDAPEPPPPTSSCEVVAAVIGPDDESNSDRRTAANCRRAYEAFGSDAVVWVQSVGGLTGSDQLTEIWDVPDTPGDQICTVTFGIETDHATGHAEGTSGEGLNEAAQQDACDRLDIPDDACRERTKIRSMRTELQIVKGQSRSNATVEVVVLEAAEGKGNGETKLDACRAAIRQVCKAGRCRGAGLMVHRIDDVPLGPPPNWPRRPDLFFGQRPKPP